MVDQAEAPVYRTIAEKAKRLRELGWSYRAIARGLGVSDKTAGKAASLGSGDQRPAIFPGAGGFEL
jgi:hypothetical protein